MVQGRRPNGYWTAENIQAAAAECATRTEFSKKFPAAYSDANAAGILDTVCAHMLVARKRWTRAECHQEALKYRTKTEFDRASSASQYARKQGWLDEICGHMVCGLQVRSDRNRKWTEKAIREAAAQCKTRNEFYQKHTAAARVATKLGIYEEICAAFPVLHESWTPELVAARAARHSSLAEFYTADPRAYEAMLRHGLEGTAGAHLRRRDPSAMDTIYLWEAVGETYNGKKVYKLGVTSQRCGNKRVVEVACRAGVESRLLVARFLGDWYVPELEKRLLAFGEDPKLDVPDGRTEFRALTAEELAVILRIIESHPVI